MRTAHQQLLFGLVVLLIGYFVAPPASETQATATASEARTTTSGPRLLLVGTGPLALQHTSVDPEPGAR